MRVIVDFDIPETTIVSTAALIWGELSVEQYCRQAAIAAAEVLLIHRIEQLRPLADQLPSAKSSLDSMLNLIELMYALDLPEISLDPAPTDAEVVSLLRDVLSDLQAFLRRQR